MIFQYKRTDQSLKKNHFKKVTRKEKKKKRKEMGFKVFASLALFAVCLAALLDDSRSVNIFFYSTFIPVYVGIRVKIKFDLKN